MQNGLILANHVVGNSSVRIEIGHSRIITTYTNWVMYWYDPHSGGDERVMLNIALRAGMGQALPIPVQMMIYIMIPIICIYISLCISHLHNISFSIKS
jgi:hypothetical protein